MPIFQCHERLLEGKLLNLLFVQLVGGAHGWLLRVILILITASIFGPDALGNLRSMLRTVIDQSKDFRDTSYNSLKGEQTPASLLEIYFLSYMLKGRIVLPGRTDLARAQRLDFFPLRGSSNHVMQAEQRKRRKNQGGTFRSYYTWAQL